MTDLIARVTRRDGTVETYDLVTAEDEPAVKAAIRCSSCGKFKHHTAFTSPLAADDDPTKPTCDDCKADATKALAKALDIPVTAYTPDGGEQVTTMAKAIGATERAEWTTAAKTIGDALKEHRRKRNLDLIISHTAQSAAKAVAAVKAERSRQRTETLRKQVAAEKAEAQRLARLAKATKARTDELLRKADDAQREQQSLGERLVSMSAAIDQMRARLADGAEQARKSQQSEATREAARRGRERDELFWKAGQVSDPLLREAYLAKANGDTLDEDD